jgi:uncharacterized protein YoxC
VTGLLTVLSVLAAWALLGVLGVGLLLVVKSLQSIRHWFEKITVGLWAIEHQTRNLTQRGDHLAVSLAEALEALDGASRRLTDSRRPPGQEQPWTT